MSTKIPTISADLAETAAPPPKTAAIETEDELPEIDETTVDSFSQEVARSNIIAMLLR